MTCAGRQKKNSQEEHWKHKNLCRIRGISHKKKPDSFWGHLWSILCFQCTGKSLHKANNHSFGDYLQAFDRGTRHLFFCSRGGTDFADAIERTDTDGRSDDHDGCQDEYNDLHDARQDGDTEVQKHYCQNRSADTVYAALISHRIVF